MKKKNKEQARIYYHEHKESIAKQKKEYYKKNKKKILKNVNKYFKKNKEEVMRKRGIYMKEYYQQHKNKMKRNTIDKYYNKKENKKIPEKIFWWIITVIYSLLFTMLIILTIENRYGYQPLFECQGCASKECCALSIGLEYCFLHIPPIIPFALVGIILIYLGVRLFKK